MKENPNDMFKGKRPPNGPNKNNRDDFQWKKGSRSVLFWVIFFLSIAFLALMFRGQNQEENEVDYATYLGLLQNNQIEKAEIVVKSDRAYEFIGYLKSEATTDGKAPKATRFKTTLPYLTPEMVAEWQQKNIEVKFVELSTDWLDYFGTVLPWILIIGIWIFFFRRIQGGGAGKNIFSFGKSRARMFMESETRVTFDDVAGCEEAKEELKEIIEFLKNP